MKRNVGTLQRGCPYWGTNKLLLGDQWNRLPFWGINVLFLLRSKQVDSVLRQCNCDMLSFLRDKHVAPSEGQMGCSFWASNRSSCIGYKMIMNILYDKIWCKVIKLKMCKVATVTFANKFNLENNLLLSFSCMIQIPQPFDCCGIRKVRNNSWCNYHVSWYSGRIHAWYHLVLKFKVLRFYGTICNIFKTPLVITHSSTIITEVSFTLVVFNNLGLTENIECTCVQCTKHRSSCIKHTTTML